MAPGAVSGAPFARGTRVWRPPGGRRPPSPVRRVLAYAARAHRATPVSPPTIQELLQHASFLRELARSLVHDEHAADDLVQDTWVAALQGPPSHGRNLAAWLRTVAGRIFFRSTRRARVPTRDPQEIDEALAAPADDTRERVLLWTALSRAVLELREPYRTVVVLRFYDDLPPRAIARRTGRPVNTVNSQLRRGLALLRAELDREHGGERGAWLPGLAAVLAAGRSRGLRAAAAGSSATWAAWLGLGAAGLVLALSFGSALDAYRSRLRPDGQLAAAEPEAARAGAERGVERPAEAIPASERSSGVGRSPARATDSTDSTGATVEADAAARPSRGFRVTVVDPNGLPVAGAEVRVGVLGSATGSSGHAFRRAAVTDGAGRAAVAIEDGDVGSFDALAECVALIAAGPGHVATRAHYVPPPEGPGVDLELRVEIPGADRIVRGVVIDEAGRPIEGATGRVGTFGDVERREGMILARLPHVFTTGPDGAFEVRGLGPGRHPVSARAPGYATARTWLEPDAVEVPTLRLMPGASVRGVVRDERGRPVAGASVFVEPEDASERDARTSGPDGSFELDGVPTGNRLVWALSANGERSAYTRLHFAPRAELEWTAALAERPALRLRVLDGDDRPLAGCAVQLTLPDLPAAWQRVAVADGDGRVVVRDVPDERVAVTVFDAPESLHVRRAPRLSAGVFRPGEEHVIRAPDRGPDAVLSGVVLDCLDRPFPEAVAVVLDAASGAVVPGGAEPASGRFEVVAPPGHHLIRASCGRHGVVALGERETAAGERADLGALRAPCTSGLDLEWLWPAGHELELHQLLDGRLWTVALIPDPASAAFDLFPGLYRLTVKRGGVIVERRHVRIGATERARVSTGGVRVIEVVLAVRGAGGPLRSPRATLRILPEEASAGAEPPPPAEPIELEPRDDGAWIGRAVAPAGAWRFVVETADGRTGSGVVRLKPGPAPELAIAVR
jgi:RNA polymerase sigma factor (sigma-70 family)